MIFIPLFVLRRVTKKSVSNSEKEIETRRRRREMAEEGSVIACHSVDEWTRQLEQANESKKLVVIDFTASWCGPCRTIAPAFNDFAKKFPTVLFLKVDVDELNTVAQDWAVEAMPTFMFVKEGSIIDKVVGAKKEELQKKIETFLVAQASQ
ncbi:hypothetical protein LUZ60_001486 [Juncus effusus]|nr:hypothetical protein LUZ60_001486 [Juncus effusus]